MMGETIFLSPGEWVLIRREDYERVVIEYKTMCKALEDIELMEPGLLDGDSSCDMSAVVAGNTLATLRGK